MQKFCILFVVIIIYSSSKLQVYCHDRVFEIPFRVNENQAEVEKLVLDYTKTVKKKTGNFCKYLYC